MKWIKKDIYGNKQVWYSGDVIDKIKKIVEPMTKQYSYDPDLEEILGIIKDNDNDNNEL